MRVTKQVLEQQLNVINRMAGLSLELDKMATGYRVYDNDGSREISPRLPAADMYRWLDGFHAAHYFRVTK